MVATRASLEARARIVRAVRAWFEREEFLEVSTPARVRSPGQEVHLDALPAGQSGGEAHWLITSPEYHLKRLVADGLSPIFEICRCWRAEESGPHHRTEFTMVEWYRADAPLEVLAADCEALVGVAFQAAGRDPLGVGIAAPFARTTVRQLFEERAGFSLSGAETAAELRAAAERAGVSVGTATAWDDIFYQVFLDRIEPELARSGPTFVFDWPAPLGALARLHPRDPRVVER